MRLLRLACLAVFLLAIHTAQAQSNICTLQGTVTDSSGAPLPNARVEVENIATGQRYSVAADDQGTYRLTGVPAGRYRVYASSGQATPAPSREFEISSDTTGFNLRVGNGASTDTIVDARPVAAEIMTAQIDTTFNTRFIEFLPRPNFVGRDGAAHGAYNLSLQSEGVTSGAFGPGRGPAVAGQRPIGNNFRIDGIDNNNKIDPGPLVYISNTATNTSALFQNQFTPVFGHSAGGKYDSVVRTGSNEFHGSIYNYLQNRHLNAVDHSFLRAGFRDHPRYDQNRLGASAGFPLLPGKIFFFGNFEYIPLGFQRPLPGQILAPTPAGFAQLSQIRGVSTSNLGILQSGVGQVSTETVRTARVAGADVPLGFVNTTARGFQNQLLGSGGLDFHVWERDQIRARYVHNELNARNFNSALPNFQTDMDRRSLLASIAEYHTFSPAVNNELRLGYNRFQMAFPGGSNALSAVPNLFFGDVNLAFGPGFLTRNAADNTYQVSDVLGWNAGGHNVRIGFDGMRYIGARTGLSALRGSFGFSTLERFLLDLPPDAFGQQSFGSSHVSDNRWLLFGYIQDNWNAAPGFQLNLGVRYQYATIPDFIRRQRFNSVADVPGVLSFREPRAETNNFAPNVGLAWSPANNRMTVFRASFGMSYDALYSESIWGAMLGPAAPQFGTAVFSDLTSNTPGFFRSGGLRNPIANVQGDLSATQARAATASVFGDQVAPYAMQWNAGVQQELWPKFTAEVKYLGSRGVHLPRMGWLNQVSPVTAERSLPLFFQNPSQAQLNALSLTQTQLRTVNPLAAAGFTSPIMTVINDGNSIFHGLAVTLKQQFAGGFQMLGNYTWSHLIDDSTGTLMDLAFASRLRSTSILDRRHRGTVTALWDIAPLFRDTGSVVRNVVANMTLAGSYTYESPQYLPLFSGSDALGAGVFVNPNGVGFSGAGVRELTNSRGQVAGFLAGDPNARFIAGRPGLFTSGGSRSVFPLDSISNVDLSLTKRFSYRDRWGFEIRGEAYNLFNHSQFTAANIHNLDFTPFAPMPVFLVPGNQDFGNFQSFLPSHSRLLQLALRLTF